MLSFTLTKAGYEIEGAVDEKDGLAKVESKKLDLVITDLNMPNMDGIQMIAGICKSPAYACTPILILTTESEHAKKDGGWKARATGWIVKPFNSEQLLAAVQMLVKLGAAAADFAPEPSTNQASNGTPRKWRKLGLLEQHRFANSWQMLQFDKCLEVFKVTRRECNAWIATSLAIHFVRRGTRC
jgi:two-component system chemotaxis response regulator CheY